MDKINSAKNRVIALALLLLIILASLFLIQPLVAQEGNPFPFFVAIMKLETSHDVVQIRENEREKVYLTKSGLRDGNPYLVMLQNQGYKLHDQLESHYVLTRDGEQLNISSKAYTRFYTIWQEHR